MAVLGSAALLTAEVNAGIEVFKLLEPEIQKGFISLFHLFHHKQTQLAAAQHVAPAANVKSNMQNQDAASTRTTDVKVIKPMQDLSSTSTDPEMPFTS